MSRPNAYLRVGRSSIVVNIDVGAIAAALVSLCTLGNTALLIWNHNRLSVVKHDVDGAKMAATEAATKAGFVQGMIASTRPPVRVGNPPTENTGIPL